MEVGCRAYLSADQAVPNITHTAVAFDADTYDPLGMHDPATNPSRLTVPAGKGGYWLVMGMLGWRGNNSGARIARIMVNGATQRTVHNDSPTHSDLYSQTLHDIINLAAGDYIEMTGWQQTGGSLNMVGSDARTFLIATLLA